MEPTTLVLNTTMEPIAVVSWQTAVILWCKDRVEVISTHERPIKTPHGIVDRPSVIRLKKFVNDRRLTTVPFTRTNIYSRDHYICQYCQQQLRFEDLTLDHVKPECQGGKKTWDNIVTACKPCNRRKGGRTPEQAGMLLRVLPVKPEHQRFAFNVRNTPEDWKPYVQSR